MKCKIQGNDLIMYAEGSLPEERKKSLESHLAECNECKAELAFLRQSLDGYREG